MSKKKSLTPLFLVIGVGSLIAAVVVFFLQEATLTWTEGVAVIESGEVAGRPGSGEGANSHLYEPMVTYTYSVGDKKFTGNQIAIVSHHYKFEGTAEAVLKKYAVGLEVPVFYDPADPGSAVLEKGGSLASPLMVGLGGLVMLLFAFFEHRSRQNEARHAAEAAEEVRVREEQKRREEEELREQAARPLDPDKLISDQDEARELARKIIAQVFDAARENPEVLEVARGGFNAQVVKELRWVFQDMCEEMRV